MNAREELISIITSFTPEQLEKFKKILNQVQGMGENYHNELIGKDTE